MSSGYRPSELTGGERLWVNRKRAGLTLQEAARDYNVTQWRYTEWEHDRPTGEPQPWVVVDPSKLEVSEQLLLARRRSGWTLKRVARAVGVSHVTLLKYEASNETVGNPLWEWWELTQGWPRRLGVQDHAAA